MELPKLYRYVKKYMLSIAPRIINFSSPTRYAIMCRMMVTVITLKIAFLWFGLSQAFWVLLSSSSCDMLVGAGRLPRQNATDKTLMF